MSHRIIECINHYIFNRLEIYLKSGNFPKNALAVNFTIFSDAKVSSLIIHTRRPSYKTFFQSQI